MNLRTVQRMESSGVASLQSRKALAAAFNIDVHELDSPEETMKTRFEYRVLRFDVKWNALGTKLPTDFGVLEQEMNVLGAEGWDLVKVSEVIAAGGGAPYTFALVATFKRAVE